MTKQITIDATELAAGIIECKDAIGGTGWGIYVNDEGEIDCRHNTYSGNEWYELIDLYSFWDDDGTLNCSAEELGARLKSDAIPYFEIDSNDTDETGEFIKILVGYK